MLRPTQTLDPFVSAEAEHLRNKEHKQEGLFWIAVQQHNIYLNTQDADLKKSEIFDCFAFAKDLSIMYEWILVNGENAVKEHLFLYTVQYNLLYALILLALCSFCLPINLFSAVTLVFAHSLVTKYCNLLQIS